jgi:hypothetical protein
MISAITKCLCGVRGVIDEGGPRGSSAGPYGFGAEVKCPGSQMFKIVTEE